MNCKGILFAVLFMAAASTSCSDYLDRAPTADLDQNQVFSEMRLVRLYHDGLYNHVASGRREFTTSAISNTDWGYDVLSQLDGHFICGYEFSSTAEMLLGNWISRAEGSWASGLAVGGKWNKLYSAIRAVNLFLDNAPRVPVASEAESEELRLMVAEAKFLRAFFYLQLVQRWGGVPLVKRVLSVDEELRLPRDSFRDCLDFIIQDLDEAAGVLGIEPRGGDAWMGRATKGAALAFKARALLWGASSYWSSKGAGYTWKEAADAAMAVIDLGKYDLYEDYRTLLFSQEAYTGARPEHIFWFNVGTYEYWRFNPFVHQRFGGWGTGNILPTQEFVDCYEILDESTGKYVPFDRNNPDHLANIYNKDRRDPRFDQSILYNGSVHQGTTCGFYVGGNMWIANTTQYYTGYNYKRWYSESLRTGGSGNGNCLMNWPFIRYADILLMYAEAQNQVGGPRSHSGSDASRTALWALNRVRERAGLTPLDDNISQAEFDERLRNERAVEMPMEDIRFFDIRRWGIGQVAWNPVHQAYITREGDSYTFDFSKTAGPARQPFANDEQAILYPIHHEELKRNPNLEQNPGWEDIYRP